MALTPGTRIGTYEIVSAIGAGGMGEVYRATDTKLKRQVAIKMLPPSLAADRDRLDRFQREAEALASVNHPHIAAVYGLEDVDGVKALVMELVDGEDLARHLARGPLPLDEALRIGRQIAEALEAAHEQGVIHRDVKPGNIIVRPDGSVKLLDFGLAKLTPADAAHVGFAAPTRSVTDPGTVLGTALYMSPEQARGLTVDARTDIFSLGVLLYEMVAGRVPFDGSSTGEIVASILSEKEPQPLARYSRDAPAELERMVSKALRKNRQERYQTMQDLRLDLMALGQQLEFERRLERTAPPLSSGPSSAGRPMGATTDAPSPARSTLGDGGSTGPATRNRRGSVIVVALLVIAAAIGSYLYFMRAHARTITSVAVLPFVNASGNTDVEYLSEGLTDSLISSLSQLPGLSVKSRSTVFRYKNTDVPPKELGNLLNVGAMLTGRVVQRGDDVTLYIELVEADTETVLWSEAYHRSLADLVSLPSEIARDASGKMRLTLSGADEQKLAKNYTKNAEAYQAYLKGRFYSNKWTEIGLQKGIEYFHQAIAIDPDYALAWAGLAYAYWGDSDIHVAPDDVMPKAKQAALKAIAIDGSLAEAHAALAIALTAYDWDWPGAESEFRRAIALNPEYPTAHAHYGWYLSLMARTDEAIAESNRAIALDPLSTEYNYDLGLALFRGRRTGQAIVQFRKTLDLAPNDWITRTNLGWALISERRFGEAIAELQAARQIDDNHYVLAALGQAYALSGSRSEALGTIAQMKEWSKQRYVSPHSVALVYAGLGDTNLAFEWLEKALDVRSEHLSWIQVDPRVDLLRSDPRFAPLARRVGF